MIGRQLARPRLEMPGDGPWPMLYGMELRGNGVFVHDDPTIVPPRVFGGTTALHDRPGFRHLAAATRQPRRA